MDVVRRANLHAVDISGEHWVGHNSKLVPAGDFWHNLDLVMRRIDRTKPDQSFLQFLESKPGGKALARERQMALEFVQGFHSADAAVISAHALAEGGTPGEDPEAQRTGRVADGYDRVPAALAEGLGDRIHTGVVVQRVQWQRGRVRVHTSDGRELDARTALVTVPLGVLQSRAIQFDPVIPTVERALRLLAMGVVLRVAFLFDAPFWEERHELVQGSSAPYDFSFLHATHEPIPVWWTSFPSRAPLIVGWSGGPNARAQNAHSFDEITDLGIQVLSRQFDVSKARLRRRLQGSWMHDWERDPYSFGAYSYPAVGGAQAGKILARPADRTVFFAGEAADPTGRNGTVDGAIATGMRAARQLLRALS
jgi:monoamine oxidase